MDIQTYEPIALVKKNPHNFSQSVHITVKSCLKVMTFLMLGKDGPSNFVLANTIPAYATRLHMLS